MVDHILDPESVDDYQQPTNLTNEDPCASDFNGVYRVSCCSNTSVQGAVSSVTLVEGQLSIFRATGHTGGAHIRDGMSKNGGVFWS